MTTLRLVAAELRRYLDSLPFRALLFAMLAYRLACDDGQPWWLAVALLLAASGIGAFLGWRKARKRNH